MSTATMSLRLKMVLIPIGVVAAFMAFNWTRGTRGTF